MPATRTATRILNRLYGWMKLVGTTSAGAEKAILTEDDGTLQNSLYGTQTDTTLTAMRVESTGEQATSLHGDAAGTITSFKVETTGEQDIVIHGKDSGGNIDPLRTNASQQLQVEIIGGDGKTGG